MSKNERFTAVIVDTNAFVAANSDFSGIKSSLLQSFFGAIKEKGLKLLSHPIIEKEVEKHIEESSICSNFQKLRNDLTKCKEILKMVGDECDEFATKICDFNIKQKMFNAFKNNYFESYVLNYPAPEIVFEQYFSAKAPFSPTGKKKSEFPDAFVIESIKDYIDEHDNEVLLVVTNDGDWKKALEETENIEICESIDLAVKKINDIKCILDAKTINLIFKAAYDEIIKSAYFAAQCEGFELLEYEIIDELDISDISIESISDNFTPLKITRESVLLKTSITFRIVGEAEIFDEENSIWNSESQEYVYVEHADLKFNGVAESECEIEIEYDFDVPESNWVKSFRLTNKSDIEIKCVDADLLQIGEDEMAIRCLREDKGLPRKH